MLAFSKIPFLRIIIPFVIGICSGIEFDLLPIDLKVMLVILAGMTATLFLKKQFDKSKFAFQLMADLLLVLVGINLVFYAQIIHHPDYYGNKLKNETVYCLAEVDDIPVQKNKTVKVNFKLLRLKTDSVYVPVEGTVMAYVQNCRANQKLVPGEVFLIHASMQQIREPMNPHAFDFKSYLNGHGIYHSAYLDSNSLIPLKAHLPLSVWQIGLAVKHQIITGLKESGLSKEAYSICSALLTGFDDEIDKSVIENFSHSGTLHVLSVSGLHVGLIYLVLNFIGGVLDRQKRFKLIQLVLISLVLWGFALITGFSAPVLRSVIMFNLLGFGNLFFRNKSYNQMNILFASAFILLVYDPLLIKDIGFLLSYSALFGILFFYPKFEKRIESKSKLINYIWQSTAVSLAATITTLPITLLVFHQFPLWFAFANLIIVPATSLLLFLSFVALFKISVVSWFINAFTSLLLYFIGLFNSDAYAFIDRIDFNGVDTLCLILILFALTALIIRRNYTYALLFFAFTIGWQLIALFDSYDAKMKKEVVIYQIPRSNVVSVKNKTDLILNRYDSSAYTMQVKPNLITYNNADIRTSPFNCLRSGKCALLVLNQKNTIPQDLNLSFSHVLIADNAIPSPDFLNRCKLKMLIADGSNSTFTLKTLEKLCAQHQIGFYNCREKGAFVLPL